MELRLAVVAWSVMLLLAVAAGCSPQPAANPAPSPDVAASAIARVPAPPSTPPILPVTTPLLRTVDGAAGPPAPVEANGHGSPPVRIRIPAIGVDSSITRLGLAPDGTIQVPGDTRQAGWYTRGPAPGDTGPAVILGHLDSTIGPAVFAQLSRLRSGDQVLVARADGTEVRFTVERVATFSVDSFPTETVYGAVPDPVLRLITCGGSFNRSQGRYLSNVVVFAVEAS